MIITTSQSRRPRNVDAPRAAAILYGDWGTSKAYVIGLAFAVAGYSSFWLILMMSALVALVGVNYMVICKHYPEGGGVYASVRHRSEIISIVGAFMLIADYLVTAAISALSAFTYLRVPYPTWFAAAAILIIGALNYYGPRATGGLAFLITVPTVIVVMTLGAFTLTHIPAAIHNLQPLHGGLVANWKGFVGIVLALSGVEAIANSTGVMKLNHDSPPDQPSVTHTSTPAILWVLLEVCIFTTLLGLGMQALNGLQVVPGLDGNEVNAPGQPGVRDFMLRYMAEVFVGQSFGHAAGVIAAVLVSLVFGFLLLSAVNTAIMALVAICFLMSRDKELPDAMQNLNHYGVPIWGLTVATIVPAILILSVGNVTGLADLYAVGVVGAIATNLGATSTDRRLSLTRWERGLMFITAVIMIIIEISLFLDKPNARIFVVMILAVGLIFRALAREKAQRGAFIIVLLIITALLLDNFLVLHDYKTGILAVTVLAIALIVRGIFGERVQRKMAAGTAIPGAPALAASGILPAQPGSTTATSSINPMDGFDMSMLCAVRGIGGTLNFAIDEAKATNRPLYILFIREQFVITSEDIKRKWTQDEEASQIFRYALEHANGHTILPCYAVSDSPVDTIVDVAATIGASLLILGAPHRSGVVKLLRGNIIQQVAHQLPEDIHLVVYA